MEEVLGEGCEVGVTTSSRHWGVRAVVLGLEMGTGPLRPWIVEGGVGEGATDWKAWMGRASKNSWAKMKGVLVGSGVGF